MARLAGNGMEADILCGRGRIIEPQAALQRASKSFVAAFLSYVGFHDAYPPQRRPDPLHLR